MSRHFTKASLERLIYTLGGMTTFPFGTFACVVKAASDMFGATYGSVFEADGTTDDAMAFFIDGDWTGSLAAYNTSSGTVRVPSTQRSVFVADGWVLVGWCKATGTVTPRFHRYRWGAGDWFHDAGDGTDVNMTATMTGFRMGVNHTSADGYDGDIAAVMMIPNYVMSDNEFERLPDGRWDRWVDSGGPGFLVEFPTKSQPALIGCARDVGRGRAPESSITGTTRAASDPPGFRFSRYARRR